MSNITAPIYQAWDCVKGVFLDVSESVYAKSAPDARRKLYTTPPKLPHFLRYDGVWSLPSGYEIKPQDTGEFVKWADVAPYLAGTTAAPAHETIVSEGSNLVCTACGTTAGNAALEGRIVSVDVSTSEEDAGNRIFANLTGETGSDGTTLLAYEVSRNFAGNAAPTEAPAKQSRHRITSWSGKEITPADLVVSLNTYGKCMPGAARAQWAMREAAAYIAASPAATAAPGDLPVKFLALSDEYESKRWGTSDPIIQGIYIGTRNAYRHAALLASNAGAAPNNK